jgi:2-dehydropantoate 2-reductase
MATWPRVVVVGPGGVGAYFGGMLARAGATVTMLGRSGSASAHLEAMARDGLRLDTVSFDERVLVKISTSPDAVAGADLVLFCVKTVDTEEASRQIAPHLSERSLVVDLQNGVDNPERMRENGIDPIPAVVYVAAAIEKPGAVKHRGRGDLVIGHPDRASDVARVVSWLEPAGIPVRVSGEIMKELWLKLILNSMANPISALTDRTYGSLLAFEPAWQVAAGIASEAVAVAGAEGHAFDLEEVIAKGLEVCRSVGAATSSTQQDIARGRPTEIDALNGFIARRAEAHGIPAPLNQGLWALVKLRERNDRR